MESDENNLDIHLAKATNPLANEIDCDIINGLCEAINERSDGPQVALRFLAHKIQSPQERESLQALMVLEKLTNSCGHRFIDEVGKFRFLNEVIKVVSPKYLAHRSSPKVKQRVIELMFLWSLEIKEMPKIFEAYQMLKKQGIVTEDPIHILPNYKPPTPPLPRPKDEIFDDEKNAELLRTLLQGGKPEDLEAANRLIKSLAKEADKRMDLKARFQSEVETVYNNAKVLSDMLTFYSPTETSTEEKDLMKELFESCERLRIRLFKLANDLSDNDPNMSRLFNANDELTKVINLYKEKMGIVSTDESKSCLIFGSESKPLNLLDMNSPTNKSLNNSNDVELLDDHMSSLIVTENSIKDKCISSSSNIDDLGELFSKSKIEMSCNGNPVINDILLPEPIKPLNSSNPQNENQSKRVGPMGPMSALEELNALSQSLIKKNLSIDSNKSISNAVNSESSKTSLNELQKLRSNSQTSNTTITSPSIETEKAQPSEVTHLLQPLTDVNVSLESIEPSDTKPLTLYDKNDIKVILHFATNSPRIDVNVMVITIMSTNHLPVSQINFLAAVPKSMRVKLQPLSGNTLPAYRPFIPPSAITQVMLIARNIHKTEKVRLKYKFSYSISDELHTDVGEVDSLFDNCEKS